MLEILHFTLLSLLLVVTVFIVFSQHLVVSAILMCVFSSLIALIYLTMNAPDVAITEASVGAGLSTVLTFAALFLIKNHKVNVSHNPIALFLMLFLAICLSHFIIQLPDFGSQSAPIHQHVAPYYIENTKKVADIPNIVTAVLASFRGYDTFGETIVVFIAALCITLTLKEKAVISKMETTASPHENGIIKDPVLNAITFLMVPFIVLFGLYIQFHGDYTPGGGFQAGIIIASGIILYSMLFGITTTLKAIPYSAIKFTNVLGILIYGGTGIATILLGQNFLSYNALSANDVTGQKLGIFLVELGVALTVCSSMLIIYINFARRKNDDFI
ncbi:Na(+)/H(+) antiporter subunit B [Wolbachia endosymbiont of Ctenocephalides felis wCfeT]|uniref:Na(+)/H(+) antiporter subunit B n=1 Tax=Wolbachia endosymbiont of Ctenocephalides felis wCfeT TaxID=2732593 RepID=UPI001447C921|nr:Na(+)/H(+) antiporter subunit B [Wolbachia endosymbiont of Ctenocephalides felis wCfeT]